MGAPRSRIYTSDEELAKRDDDHKRSKMGSWNVKHRPSWRKRRLIFALMAGIAVWLFIHYIPTDLGPVDRTTGRRYPPKSFQSTNRAFPGPDPNSPHQQQPAPAHGQNPQYPHEAPITPPFNNANDDNHEESQRNFDGPVRFYYLASTLRAARTADDAEYSNRNVLFAASDLKAAASLVPMACDMARWKRNKVHFAIMGRSDLPIETIQELNGVSLDTCPMLWHNARPDFIAVSTDSRLEISVAGATGHINTFVHPHALISADLESEDIFFAKGIDRKVKQLGMTHIQIPKSNSESLAWLARLDSASLKAWHAAAIDVLIRAPLDSSGSLIRLLKSLADADYTGFRPPRLTVELPHKLDDSTQLFLNKYHWPPGPYSYPGQTSELIIRRRIFEQRASVDESSHRFIESFYPSSSTGPHVLLLSPQAELSPVYFHYLKLNLLEHLYSSKNGDSSRNLLGISLESPTTHLDGKTLLQPPKVSSQQPTGETLTFPFRWQAPNGNAALYFADKWMEIHSFFMRRHSATRQSSLKSHFQTENKFIAQTYPAWMEYILQLMQARGTTMLYPAPHASDASDTADSLVTIHNELYQMPEEFSQPEQTPKAEDAPSADDILTVKDDYLNAHHPNSAQKTLHVESPLLRDLTSILPAPILSGASDPNQPPNPDQIRINPAIPPLSSLPVLDFSGNKVSTDDLIERAKATSITFRSTAGGCSAEQSRSKKAKPMSAADLFCFDDDEDEQTKAPGAFTVSTSEVKHEEPHNEPALDDDDDDNDEADEDHTSLPPSDIPPQNPDAAGPVPEAAQPVPNPNIIQAPPVSDPLNPLGAQNPAGPVPAPEPAAPPPQPPQPPPVPNSNAVPPAAQNPPAKQPATSSDDGNAFPVLDPSKIQAFDEGREVERDSSENAQAGT